ncbi:unannotated protein [freshwater metagenome]|uniref:Unannotated protein n=1 Tax=freshwater metagenome TaxID=449393 RepID=A0A6J6XMH1_9ZZZZ|nr:hypothetical protein [Actinomycetota bacterium]MSX82018.1 hypothetical protein [Actinomycetota bacterium]
MAKRQKIITPRTRGNSAQINLRIAAALLLGIGIFIAVIAGLLLPAEVTHNDLSFAGGKGIYVYADYLRQPISVAGTVTTTFNWLFFFLIFAPFLISSAILFSGSEVSGAVARRTRTRSSSSSTEPDGT